MTRLGLAGRVILSIALAIVLIQSLGVMAYLSERREADPGRALFPFPEQLAAIVASVEAAPGSGRATLLRALSGPDMQVSVAAAPPDGSEGGRALAADRRWLSQVAALAGRELRVTTLGPGPIRWFPRLGAAGVRVSVRLTDGDWLSVERRRAPGRTIGGLPLGTISALLSLAVAVAALVVVWREMRPLRQLTEAVRGFGTDLRPRPLPVPETPDLKLLVAAVNRMQTDIAAADQSRTDMIAALSHDIRTPLARLTLRLRGLPPDVGAAAERDIAQIAQVADGAFRFVGVDMARMDMPVDLRALLTHLAETQQAGFADATLHRPAQLRGNAELLTRAFANLVENAHKYAGAARLSLTVTEQDLQVRIEDDGPGIPPAEFARLMQPFQRGDAARSDPRGGLGLGLSLAVRIVARHGGTLAQGAGPAAGLTLIVTLPRDAGAAVPDPR